MVKPAGRSAGRGPRVGIALSANTLCAAIAREGDARPRAWRASIAPLNGEGSGWVALVEALRALAAEIGAADGGRLCIALMPPLAEARGIELPPVGEREAQLLLARSAGRYFTAARGPQVIGAVRARTRTTGVTQPVVAAAASTRLLQAIHEAARNASWSIDTIVPAEAAWAAAGATWSRRRSGPSLLLVTHSDRTDLVRVEGEALAGVRRFRAGGADASLIAEAATDAAARVSVVGDLQTRRDLSQALANRGISVQTPATSVPDIVDEPDFLAAVFATSDSAPRLITDVERAQKALSARRLTSRIAAAAAVLLVVAGGVEFWGVKRELRLVQDQRDALRPQLATTLVGRTSVETAYQQLAVLANAERTAPEWSAVLAGITSQLPLEAYLTGFRGHGDSVAVDGLAARAARVFDALDRVRVLSNVRATAPVRLETPIDGPPLERFTISALVGSPSQPARGATAGRGGARR